MGALVGAVIAGYVRIRRHMTAASKAPQETTKELEQEIRR